MNFTDLDEQRMARMEAMIVAIARGKLPSRGSVLQLARNQRIGTSKAGVVGAVVALTGAAIGGTALVLHSSGIADRLRTSADTVSASIQAVPDLVLPAPRPSVTPTPEPAATRHHAATSRPRARPRRQTRARPDVATRQRGAGSTTAPDAAAQALRDAYADDARRTRDVNEAALDALRRR